LSSPPLPAVFLLLSSQLPSLGTIFGALKATAEQKPLLKATNTNIYNPEQTHPGFHFGIADLEASLIP